MATANLTLKNVEVEVAEDYRTFKVEVDVEGTINPGCPAGYGDPGERAFAEDVTATQVTRVWEDGKEVELTAELTESIILTLNGYHEEDMADGLMREYE